jgi:hypothetical protein
VRGRGRESVYGRIASEFPQKFSDISEVPIQILGIGLALAMLERNISPVSFAILLLIHHLNLVNYEKRIT